METRAVEGLQARLPCHMPIRQAATHAYSWETKRFGGGWGKEARKVWSELAKLSAQAAGELASESAGAISFLQRLSVTLHKENARAVLRRLGASARLPEARLLFCLC